jgi:hypothetical protein
VEWDEMPGPALGSSHLSQFTLVMEDEDGAATTQTLAPQARAFTFGGLVPAKAYTFRIKAHNLVGESEWSASTEALYPGVEPTRPGSVTFTASTRTRVTYELALLLDEDTGGTATAPVALTYHVYLSTQEAGGYTRVASVTSAGPWDAEHLTPGERVYFKYRAENSFGLESEFSSTYGMIPGRAPSAPAVGPVLLSQSSSALVFRVLEPADSGGPEVLRYEVEVLKTLAGSSFTPIALAQGQDVADPQTFTFDAALGLEPGFAWAVRARVHTFTTDYFAAATAPWSATSTFVSSELPKAVSTFSSGSVTKTSVTLSWAQLLSAEDQGHSTTDLVYTLEMDLCGRTGSSAQFVPLLASTTATSYTLTEQAPGSTCRFRVHATNVIGQGPDSETLDVLFAVAPA